MRTLLLPIPFACAVILAGCSSETRIVGEGQTITVQGRLSRETFPGPPNYESIEKGDHPETYWVLGVNEPVCARGEDMENGDLYMSAETQRLQLVMKGVQYNEFKSMTGSWVKVSGEVFIGHTGHHNTPVLLDLTRHGKIELLGD